MRNTIHDLLVHPNDQIDDLFIQNADKIIGQAYEEPQDLWTMMLDDTDAIKQISEKVIPVHYGILVTGQSQEKIEQILTRREYDITSQFASTIVSKELSKKYGENIEIEIIKASSGKKELELFVVKKGLTKEQILEELSHVNHLAFRVGDGDIAQLVKTLTESGFSRAGGGTNPHELAKGETVPGVTTLYFHPPIQTHIPKIELFVPGTHPELISR